MSQPRIVSADDVVAALESYDAIVDVRSPSEYDEDHLPGAVNWPVLDDAERARVGTLYVQHSPLEARQVGAALVARNVADHLERQVQGLPREWQPLVYCWRGGQRSGAMAWFLAQIGFRTAQLQGGYKAFRARVRQDLAVLPTRFHFRVLAGRTGSGKTRLLRALAEQGAQVLDLEALACHRGSVLGGLPNQPQPSQKGFDTLLWQTLRRLDPGRPLFVESESKKVGSLQLPDALVQRMHEHGACLRVQMSDAARIELLLQEYGFFADDVDGFCKLLDALIDLQGRERVQRWQAMARAGAWRELFAELMREHYDPLYERSMSRNFSGLGQAPVIELGDGTAAAITSAAHALLV